MANVQSPERQSHQSMILTTAVTAVVATLVLGCASYPAAGEEPYSDPKLIDEEDWAKYFEGQRILFGLSPDGEFTVYVSSDRTEDPGGYPIEEITLRPLAVEIGGENTKVCWTSGGDKHCDPPPPR